MTRLPTRTHGQRIAARFATGWYGSSADREKKLAAAIDRAIKVAQRNAGVLPWRGAKKTPHRRRDEE